jgi:hypothetical protein
MQIDAANATTGFPGNPNIGDVYLDPSTSQCRLTNSLSEWVQQELYTRFKFFQGEWFLDRTLGLPWFQQILGIKNSPLLVQSILRQTISTCPGVAAVIAFQPAFSGRAMTLVFACRLTDGSTLDSKTLPPFRIQLP